MEGYVFITASFTKAIEDYLDSKDKIESVLYNSFNVTVIRLLATIYDELDILNPYYLNNQKVLYNNLRKYDYPNENIDAFFKRLENFSKKENKEDFINIQKDLIDMFGYKKQSIDIPLKEIQEFKNLLYSSKSENPLRVSYNFMLAQSDTILNYFEDKMAKSIKKIPQEQEKEMLSQSAYELLKYSFEDVSKLDNDALKEINKEVYNHFDINENAINRKYLLDKAVNDLNRTSNKFATSHGYVDIIFILSIIVIVILVTLIVTFIII